MAYSKAARRSGRRIRIRKVRVAGLLVLAAASAAVLGYPSLDTSSPPAASRTLPGTVWPAAGQAAVEIGQAEVQAGPNQHPAAIASVAKVMTAYLVLRDHPLRPGQAGPAMTLTGDDVADTDRRRG